MAWLSRARERDALRSPVSSALRGGAVRVALRSSLPCFLPHVIPHVILQKTSISDGYYAAVLFSCMDVILLFSM